MEGLGRLREYLPHKHWALGLNRQVESACNPSAKDADAEGSQGMLVKQSSQTSELQAQRGIVSQQVG